MLVKLPRTCSGSEIVEAFKAAAQFEEGPGKEWRAVEVNKEFQYEPGSVLQTIRSVGVLVRPYFLKKKWILFGERVWEQSLQTKFKLSALNLSRHYHEVEVEIEHVYEFDVYSRYKFIVNDPNSEHFEDIRLQFERVIAGLYSILQPQQA
ncbi:MAG: hypothetical protein Q8Q06_03940 [bacterium]|nr:hypothetical protein [bacterium]